MKDEVAVAVRFLSRLIEKNNAKLSASEGDGIEKDQLEVFTERLAELLCQRFQNHWFPEKPARGQGYRCIRLNESDRKDPVIDQAAVQCGLSYEQLRLPTELTIWVDPKEVCCRFGEHQGSFCTLASFKNGSGEIYLDQVNLEEIHKKSMELREKVVQEMATRKNGRKGFLSNGSSPNNYKGSRYNNNNHSGGAYMAHHHSHHGNGGGGALHPYIPANPAALNWYHSNSNNNNTSSMNNMNNHHPGHMGTGGAIDMFSTSPPNHHFSMYSKPSPPKYVSAKWSSAAPTVGHGPWMPGGKSDKYHWFNSNKATIKA